MQRLDLAHPGKGQLVVGPVALRYDRHLVLAGAFERPVVIGGDILDHRKRVVPGIEDAFEEGHAVSTLPFDGVDTHAGISTRFRGDASLHLQSAERMRPARIK
jgi:hypothetical protein